jgi:hypothetical protein
MKRKRFSVKETMAVLKQAEVGMPVAKLIRQVGIKHLVYMTSGLHEYTEQKAVSVEEEVQGRRTPKYGGIRG